MPKLLSLLLIALLHLSAFAQRTVSSRVVAQSTKEPLPQVTVRIDGQPTSTVTTDDKGRFSLSLPAAAANPTLIFSCVGYQPLTASADKLGADVTLEEQRYMIGEVQVSYVQLQKLLVRTWKIDPASLDAAAQVLMLNAKSLDPKKYETLAKNPDAVRKVLEMARYDFRKDGVVKAKLMLFSNKQHWKLDEENRQLTIINDEGRERPTTVVELTAERMVLKRQDGDTPEVAYVPAD